MFQSLSPVEPIPTATETNVEPSQQGPVKSVQLPQELATETAVAPTSVPMVMVAPTESLQVIYRSARVGLDDSRPYWLTYDTNTWSEEPNPEHPDAEVLVHRFLQGCELRQNYGHGVPSTWAHGYKPRNDRKYRVRSRSLVYSRYWGMGFGELLLG